MTVLMMVKLLEINNEVGRISQGDNELIMSSILRVVKRMMLQEMTLI